MYIVAQKYKCDNCGHEIDWSPDDHQQFPVFQSVVDTGRGLLLKSNPVCPKCFEAFIKANVGLMYDVFDWDGKGSDYRKEKERLFIEDREYSKKWDAMYSKSEDRWLESMCDEPECEYCARRPEKPSDDSNLY